MTDSSREFRPLGEHSQRNEPAGRGFARDARVFLAGQSVSLLGDTSLWLALAIWAKQLTGSNSAAGIAILCVIAPQLLSPLAGVVVDRVRRRPLLLAGNLASALIVLSLLLVRDRVGVLYAVALLYGASYTLLSAGQVALLTTVVAPERLGEANALLQTVREALRLLAPVLGAGLYATAGGSAVALLDAATFLVAAASLLVMRVREAKPQPRGEPWREEVLAGARHLRDTPSLRRMTVACAVVLFVLGFSETLNFAILDGVHRPVSFAGVLMAAQGVGAVIAAVIAPRVMHATGELRLVSTGMAALAVGTFGLAGSSLAVVLVAKAVYGFGIPWIVIGAYTLLQRLTPNQLQGRAFSATEVVLGAPQTLSIALGAALVTIVDYRALLLVQAAFTAAAALYLVRAVRRRGDGGRAATARRRPPIAPRARGGRARARMRPRRR